VAADPASQPTGVAAVPVKLRAEDVDDLAVISACVQDAIVAVRDLGYEPEERRFMLVANRFRWESGAAPVPEEPGFERVLCAMVFSEVAGVSYRGFRRTDEDRILSLLAIRADPVPAGNVVHLEFSGNAEIRLTAGRIRCRLKDLGEPWPTAWHPQHPVGETA